MEDGDLNPAIVWTVASATDPDAVQLPLGTGATVTSSLARGSYLVTAGVTDFGGLGIVKQIGVTVGCSVVGDLQPAEGLKIPQLLQLDASGSYDTCGRPLQYFWVCVSDTSVTCPDFVAAANANGNTNPTPSLEPPGIRRHQLLLRKCAWPGPTSARPGRPIRGWGITV